MSCVRLMSRLRFSSSLSANSTTRSASGSPRRNAVSVGLKIGICGRKPDHRSIDELDRDRLQRDDVLRRVHRFEERSEMADPDRAPPQER